MSAKSICFIQFLFLFCFINTSQSTEQFNVKLLPIGFGNYSVFTKVINLKPTALNNYQTKYHHAPRSCGPTILEQDLVATPLTADRLEYGHYDNGFKVIRSMKYHIGMGVGSTISHGDLSWLGVSFGVSAVKSGEVVFTRYVAPNKNNSILKNYKKIRKKIPFKAAEFSHWNLGESVSYLTEGGVLLKAGVGFKPLFGIGTKYLLSGGWKYYIKKVTCDSIILKVLKTKVRTGSAHSGTLFVTLTASQMKNMGNGFKYSINLSNEVAVKAYEEALTGKMDLLQELAADPLEQSVTRVESVKVSTQGRRKKLSLGIPYLFLRKQSARLYQYQDIEFYKNQTEKISHYGIYLRDKKSTTITKHKNRQVVFYGGIAELKDNANNMLTNDYSGVFGFSYENDWGKAWKLNSAINEINVDSGLNNYTKARLPQGIVGKTKLGYIEVNTKVKFPKKYLDSLMEMSAVNDHAFDVHRERSLKALEKYLSDNNDPDRLCPANLGSTSISERGVKRCSKKLKKEINIAYKIITSSLQRMYLILKTDKKEFAHSIARMGERMVKNRFIFQEFFKLGKKCGVSLQYKIFGTEISYFNKNFNFSDQTGRY